MELELQILSIIRSEKDSLLRYYDPAAEKYTIKTNGKVAALSNSHIEQSSVLPQGTKNST